MHLKYNLFSLYTNGLHADQVDCKTTLIWLYFYIIKIST